MERRLAVSQGAGDDANIISSRRPQYYLFRVDCNIRKIQNYGKSRYVYNARVA